MATIPQRTEEARLNALRSLKILDSPPEQAFDRITSLAQDIFDVPMAVISFVDRDRQWFKSRIGIPELETPRSWSFCTRVIQGSDVLVVPDARQDARFSTSPLVTSSQKVRFYAGAPLHTPDGFNIGALCIMDSKDRPHFDESSVRVLQELADLVVIECMWRRREFDLSAAKTEADGANQAKSEFLSRVSHEFRTPMNAILGFTQLLDLDELSDDQRSNVTRILNASRHLLSMLNEVLEISRIEMGRLAVEIETVKVYDTIRQATELVQPLLRERSITLRVEDPPAPGLAVLADPQKLNQILLNLLSNAVKYNRDAGEVIVSQEIAGDHLKIRVRDTGNGIPVELQEKLFQPFERLDAVRSKIPGTGLGLALSKRMVDQMRGTIGVESAAGSGSTFWIELPLAGSMHVEIRAPETSVPGATVLYVEDTLLSIHLIRGLLGRRSGPKVRLISAMQGNIGLEMARGHAPDLILLDLHLPDISGIQVLTHLKSDRRTASIPVVVLTADALPGTPAQVMEAGAVACLSKPVDVKEFLKTIDSVLEEPSHVNRATLRSRSPSRSEDPAH